MDQLYTQRWDDQMARQRQCRQNEVMAYFAHRARNTIKTMAKSSRKVAANVCVLLCQCSWSKATQTPASTRASAAAVAAALFPAWLSSFRPCAEGTDPVREAFNGAYRPLHSLRE